MYRPMNIFRALQGQNKFLPTSALKSYRTSGPKLSQDGVTTTPEPGKSSSGSAKGDSQPGIPSVRLTASQKRYLLLAFKHKTTADIPDTLTVKQVDALYQRARISTNLMLAVMVLMLCVVTTSLGRRDAAAGETIQKINLDWHKSVKKQHQEEQERIKASKSEGST